MHEKDNPCVGQDDVVASKPWRSPLLSIVAIADATQGIRNLPPADGPDSPVSHTS